MNFNSIYLFIFKFISLLFFTKITSISTDYLQPYWLKYLNEQKALTKFNTIFFLLIKYWLSKCFECYICSKIVYWTRFLSPVIFLLLYFNLVDPETKLLTFTEKRTISYKNQQACAKMTTAANLAKVIEFYQFYLVSYMGGGVTFYASLQKTLSTFTPYCFVLLPSNHFLRSNWFLSSNEII